MTQATRMTVAVVMIVLGLRWFLGVKIWRGRSREHSPKVFWLHLTALVVAIIFLLAAIVLLLGSE